MIIKVPASSANLGPGFDCLGLALDLFNLVEIAKADDFSIEIEGEGAGSLSLEINNNLFFKAFFAYFHQINKKPVPVRVKLINNIPLARGLGSSAATIVAGLVAACYLAKQKLNKEELFNLAVTLEGHADNVAAALFGGLVLTYQNNKGYVVKNLSFNSKIGTVVIIPEQKLKTKQARQVLPKQISLKEAVFNLSRIVLLITALAEADFKLLSQAVEDKIHQPYRFHLIDGYKAIEKIAQKIGLPALVISGAGPSLLAFCAKPERQRFKEKLEQEFKLANLNYEVKVVQMTTTGAKLEKEG